MQKSPQVKIILAFIDLNPARFSNRNSNIPKS